MRVLIADDEPIERMVVSKKLKKYFGDDYELEIIEAQNGREAVEIFEKDPFEIALLDISMPGISGLDAAEKIRETGKPCEIIFLTAFDEFSYAKRAIQVRALEYMLKPVIDDELVAAVEAAIAFASKNEVARKAEGDGSRNTFEFDLGDELSKIDNIKLRKLTLLFREYLDEKYMEDLSLQEVAEHFHYSDAYFCKIFKQCFDKGFIEYLTQFRVEKAKILLEDISVNVKDISQKVGYHDSNYFTKVFKRIVGQTPSEYRNSIMKRD